MSEIVATVLVILALILGGIVLYRTLQARSARSIGLTETDHTNERPRLDVVDDALQQRVVHTLKNGGKIAAIKELREASGWGLKESKDFVEGLERDNTHLVTEPSGTTATPADLSMGEVGFDDLDRDDLQRVMKEIREGRKINAIKELREMTGLGLKESKDLVEGIEQAGLHL